MTTKTINIDLAKNVFELCGLAESGDIVLRRRLRRESLLPALEKISACVFGIEA